MRITSGRTAMARAMHSRCCCPPDRPVPGWSSRSLTSAHNPARLSESSTMSCSSLLLFTSPWIFGP